MHPQRVCDPQVANCSSKLTEVERLTLKCGWYFSVSYWAWTEYKDEASWAQALQCLSHSGCNVTSFALPPPLGLPCQGGLCPLVLGAKINPSLSGLCQILSCTSETSNKYNNQNKLNCSYWVLVKCHSLSGNVAGIDIGHHSGVVTLI